MSLCAFSSFLLIAVVGTCFGVENKPGDGDDGSSLNGIIERLNLVLPGQVEEAIAAQTLQLVNSWSGVFGASFIASSFFTVGFLYQSTPLNFNSSDILLHANVGKNLLYGFGSGLPSIIAQKSSQRCGMEGLPRVLEDYRFVVDAVMRGNVHVQNQTAAALVDEFETELGAELSCITALGSDMVQAAQVGWTFQELFAALRLKLSTFEGQQSVRGSASDETSEFRRRFLQERPEGGAIANSAFLKERIKLVRREIVKMMPVATSAVESQISSRNKQKFFYFVLTSLAMALGVFGSTFNIGPVVEPSEVLQLGAEIFLGIGMVGPNSKNYQNPKLACGVDDFLKVIADYYELEVDPKSSTVEEFALKKFKVVEQGNSLRKALYCVTSRKGQVRTSARMYALIGLHSILMRETLNDGFQ